MFDETVGRIRYWHRRRCYAMEQRKRADLALGSFIKLMLGWEKDAPAAERTRISDNAKAIIHLGEMELRAAYKDEPFEIDEPDYLEWQGPILASIKARAPFTVEEKAATKELAALAVTLPAWQWGEPIRGFGAVSLATIVGEAGDLSEYPKKGHLWKRMGVAVMGDVRQGGLPKTAPAAAWIEHGYNRQRRSRMWNIGEALIKGNADGEYRATYLARKLYERERAEAAGLTVLPAAEIKKLVEKKKRLASGFMSEGHIHRRAQRVMEKRLLRNLWQAWRRDTWGMSNRAEGHLPVAAE